MAAPKFFSGILRGLGPDGALGQQFPKLGAKRYLPGSNIKRFGIGRGIKALPWLVAGAAGAAGGSQIGTKLQENVGWYDDMIQGIASNPVSAGIVGGFGNVLASYIPGVAGEGTLPGAQWWGGGQNEGAGLAALIDNYSKQTQMGASGMPLTREQLIGKAYNVNYDPTTGNWTAGKDPYLEAQIANAVQGWKDLEALMPKAQQRIAGYYGDAGAQARRRAAIFGEQGEQTAQGIASGYEAAGQRVADLATAGGTAVSGLTGPSQDLQGIYGTLPGIGVTGAQDVRGQTGFAIRDLEDVAREALKTGTAEGRNLANYIANLGVSEGVRLNNLLIEDQRTRANAAGQAMAQYMLEQDTLRPEKQNQALQLAGTVWTGKGKTALKDAMQKLTGKTIEDEGQLYNALFDLAATEGWDRINFALTTISARYAS